ncbi:MAG: patatin-like phospholipase family protein [Anaerolineaceae bacterium]|nr:MAG: patatin-like phospholipase family protein [Anaerolineaceae bacterium]
MLALVMSGAGNFGAMQVGALEVLLETGFHPQLVVGTSAGALNAVSFASDPTLEGLQRLSESWCEVGEEQVGMPSLFTSIRRLITRQDSLIDSKPLAEFLKQKLPENVDTFSQLAAMHGIQVYTVAVSMETGRLEVFGDRKEDHILDGVMASTAIPPYFPPWEVGGQRYLDGGVLSKLPLRVAIERGATQIVALDISYPLGTLEGAHGMIGISGYALSLMMEYLKQMEAEWATTVGYPIYLIDLSVPDKMEFWNYEQPEPLLRRGRELTQKKLDSEPFVLLPEWRLWLERVTAKFRRSSIQDVS